MKAALTIYGEINGDPVCLGCTIELDAGGDGELALVTLPYQHPVAVLPLRRITTAGAIMDALRLAHRERGAAPPDRPEQGPPVTPAGHAPNPHPATAPPARAK